MIITRETKNMRGLDLEYDKEKLDVFALHSRVLGKVSDRIVLTPKEIKKLYPVLGKILEELK